MKNFFAKYASLSTAVCFIELMKSRYEVPNPAKQFLPFSTVLPGMPRSGFCGLLIIDHLSVRSTNSSTDTDRAACFCYNSWIRFWSKSSEGATQQLSQPVSPSKHVFAWRNPEKICHYNIKIARKWSYDLLWLFLWKPLWKYSSIMSKRLSSFIWKSLTLAWVQCQAH